MTPAFDFPDAAYRCRVQVETKPFPLKEAFGLRDEFGANFPKI
jgi:hypothetical protein